jgi:hypothetical protein
MAAVEPTVSSSRSHLATVFEVTPTRTANSRCMSPSDFRTRRTSRPVMERLYVENSADGNALLPAAREVVLEIARPDHAVAAD